MSAATLPADSHADAHAPTVVLPEAVAVTAQPQDDYSRALAILRIVTLIPQLIAVTVLTAIWSLTTVVGYLAVLGSEGERFDAFLFADVLEHLEDPAGALSLARALAHPGATLVASVPNVGHLSLARDLLLGRFDPVPAGLADAGHLRWFTRRSLAATVEEAGWRLSLIEAVPGAPAPEEEPFLAWARRWPSADPHALRTYQWIAVAVAD